MKKLKLIIELEYNQEIMHESDADGIDWFYQEVLGDKNGGLQLYSTEIGDEVGKIKVIGVIEEFNEESI